MKKSTARRIALAVAVVGLGYLIRHKVAQTHDAYWIAAGWLLTASVVLRIGLALRHAEAALRATRGSGIARADQLTTDAMQPWMRGYYAVEKLVYRGTWRTLCRRPVEPAGEFTLSHGPRGARLLAVSLLAVLLVAGLAVLAVSLTAIAFWGQVAAFVAIGAVAAYAAVWLIGDRRALKEGGHAVAGGELHIDLGIRCRASVPLANVAACILVDGESTPAAETWTVSPSEQVNVLIELEAPATFAVVAFGYPRTRSARFIALYVDQPARFAAAVTRAARRAARRSA